MIKVTFRVKSDRAAHLSYLKKHLQRVCPLEADTEIKRRSSLANSAAYDVSSRGLKLKRKPVLQPESIYRERVPVATQPAETGPPSTSEP